MRGDAVLVDGFAMRFGWVADIGVPAVMREFFVKAIHDAVTRDFGDDGGGGNAFGFAIALNDGARGAGEVRRELVAINKAKGIFSDNFAAGYLHCL